MIRWIRKQIVRAWMRANGWRLIHTSWMVWNEDFAEQRIYAKLENGLVVDESKCVLSWTKNPTQTKMYRMDYWLKPRYPWTWLTVKAGQ